MNGGARMRKAWEVTRLYRWTALYVSACLTVIVVLLILDMIRETT